MRLQIIFILCLFLSSCIGDRMVMVKYQVTNKSEDTLYVKGHSLLSGPFETQNDLIYVIPPNMKQTVQTTNEVCWFGDCRIHLKNDAILDTLTIFKENLKSPPIRINKDDWKLKRTKAVLKIKK